jgi:hypothetical protein
MGVYLALGRGKRIKQYLLVQLNWMQHLKYSEPGLLLRKALATYFGMPTSVCPSMYQARFHSEQERTLYLNSHLIILIHTHIIHTAISINTSIASIL